MNDIVFIVSNPECVAIAVNAVLLVGMGLAMVFAKRLEGLVTKSSYKNKSVNFAMEAS